MGSSIPVVRSRHADEFDSVVTYLNAVSQRLSKAELLDIADTLHELVRRRRGEAWSLRDHAAAASH